LKRIIHFKGAPLTLVGRSVKVGEPAPDFRVTSVELKEVTKADVRGKIKVITSFPSIDTPVCDLQVKAFNKEATHMAEDVVILGISKDLPFAQKRFCEMFDIKGVQVLSDYKTTSFGINYGLLIKELNLLARAVLILDKEDTIRYLQIVDELTQPPDYADVLRHLEEVIRPPAGEAGPPAVPVKQELPDKCKPCEGGMLPLPSETVRQLLVRYNGWELTDGKRISKEFKFKDFQEAKYFLDLIAAVAEEQGHHPTLTIGYAKVKVSLTTHAASGLTENDFIMAKIIDQLAA